MIAYYGSKLSPHMTETPEGFLICHDVKIARTGTQNYLAREIGLYRQKYCGCIFSLEESKFYDKIVRSFEPPEL